MKKNIYILILIISLFSFNNVNAKTLENTCVYETTYNQTNVTITCKFYDNSTYDKCVAQIAKKSKKLSIQNWKNVIGDASDFGDSKNAQEWYKQNHKCLPYMIFIDTEALLSRYKLYAAESLTKANIIETNRGTQFKYKTAIAKVHGLEDEENPKAEQEEKINSYIEMLNDIGKNFDLSDCVQDGKVVLDASKNNFYVCSNKVNAMNAKLDEYNAYVKEQIDNGTFKESDDIIKEYRNAVTTARGNINEKLNQETISVSKSCQIIDGKYYDINGNKVSQKEYKKSCQDVAKDINCGIFNGEFRKFLEMILSVIRFAVPIIIIGLGIMDFIKATAAQDASEIKKASAKLVKRLIIGVIIFLLPTLIDLILDLAGIEYGTCNIK